MIFASHEKLSVAPEDFLSTVWERSAARVAVVGMGEAGALLGIRDGEASRVPATRIRFMVNTAGAGDALFSCFLHFYLDGDEPILALRKATMFAAHKVGESGASRGFLSENQLNQLMSSVGTLV